MGCQSARLGFLVSKVLTPLAALIAFLASSIFAVGVQALEGGLPAPPMHFGLLGTIAVPGSKIGQGFSAIQIAPTWALTAAHVAPPVGAIFANDYGMSVISEVLTFTTRVPTIAPIPGAIRDDIALLHLAKAITSPYLPRLADENFLPREPLSAGLGTLVSNNPGLNRRRFGVAPMRVTANVPGFALAIATAGANADAVRLVSGDSGSAIFVGHLLNTDASSVLLGIASAQATTPSGLHLAIFTRIGAYRTLLDKAVGASGEQLRWTAGPAPIRRSFP